VLTTCLTVSPSCFRSLRCHLAPLCLRHGLESPFPANLTALAPNCSHVLGEIHRGCWRFRWCGFFWRFAGGTVYDPLGELVGIAWALAFSDSHCALLLKRTPLRGGGVLAGRE